MSRRMIRKFSYVFLGLGALALILAVATVVVALLGGSSQRTNLLAEAVGIFGTAFVNVLIWAGIQGISRAA